MFSKKGMSIQKSFRIALLDDRLLLSDFLQRVPHSQLPNGPDDQAALVGRWIIADPQDHMHRLVMWDGQPSLGTYIAVGCRKLLFQLMQCVWRYLGRSYPSPTNDPSFPTVLDQIGQHVSDGLGVGAEGYYLRRGRIA
jgi:hypothetical protein